MWVQPPNDSPCVRSAVIGAKIGVHGLPEQALEILPVMAVTEYWLAPLLDTEILALPWT